MTTATAKVPYKSPKHAQVWFLQRSRNRWKAKYQTLKRDAKRDRNRLADLTKSRAHWRARAEQAEQQLQQLQQQLDALSPSPPTPPEGKKGAPK